MKKPQHEVLLNSIRSAIEWERKRDNYIPIQFHISSYENPNDNVHSHSHFKK
jgi:hypothetical protein